MATVNYYLTISGFSESEKLTVTSTGTGISEIRENISTGTSDGVVGFGSDVSQIEFLYILSTKAMTLKTYNAAAELVDTISLVANTPIIYKKSPAISTNPFASDFVSSKVTNASGATSELTILCLYDSTP